MEGMVEEGAASGLNLNNFKSSLVKILEMIQPLSNLLISQRWM